jgi:precorrin-3B synthase
MLAAMPTAPDQPLRPLRPNAAPPRDRDDACPGALRLHAADDGALARVRVPGGVLTARQAEALGAAAARLGDGEIHLTSRGNAQLRGLGAACGAELGELLTAAGLLPSAAHERVRNIVASPLSGLDGRGHLDVRPWLRDLDALLCAGDPTRALSGRFLFALDDGRGDVAALAPDITLRAAPHGRARITVGRAAPLLVPATAGPRTALLAAELFLTAAAASASDSGAPAPAWRVTDLPDGGAGLTPELALHLDQLGIPTVDPEDGADGGRRSLGGRPALGVIANPRAPQGDAALSVLAPLGRLTAGQWRALVAVAGRGASGEVRMTPWRGIVVTGVDAGRAGDELAALEAAGLVTDAGSPWVGIGACVGRPGCGKSLADVRADAAAAVHPENRPEDRPPSEVLPVYWAGCARGCGRPRGDRVDVVATAQGYRVDLVRDGAVRTSTTPRPPDLAATVAAARSGAVSR